MADGHTHLYHGHNDVDLSPAGIRQCEAVAAYLQEVPLAGVYSSDLTRTRRGAEIIAQGRQVVVEAYPEFREVHFGVWEGLSFQEIMERYPEELQQRFRDLANFRIPGGESLLDLKGRALPKLQELIQRHQGEAFLLVAHAGINRVILVTLCAWTCNISSIWTRPMPG